MIFLRLERVPQVFWKELCGFLSSSESSSEYREDSVVFDSLCTRVNDEVEYDFLYL